MFSILRAGLARTESGLVSPGYHRGVVRLIRTKVHSHTPPKTSRSKYLLGGLGGVGLYLAGTLYPPEELRLLYPLHAPPPIADLTSPEAISHINNLENALQSLSMLKERRAAPDADDWYETRPYADAPADRRVNHLTGGALRGPGKLALPPLVRAKKDESEAWILVHLGRSMCGHDGIIHGGLLATLLDESLGREAIVNLPEKVGVTATLTLNYRAPTRADQFVIIKTKRDDMKGRKIWVSGSIEDLNGKTLVDATAMFVQPKYANLLNKKQISQSLGDVVAPPRTVPPAADGQALISK